MKKDALIYRILRPIIKGLFIFLYRPNIIGSENIPKDGRVVVCGNHTHNWDSPLLMCSTKRTIHFLAKDELFKGIGKYFFKSMACIPVNRRQKDRNALESAVKVLEADKVIGIFPEGTFNRTNDIVMPFKYGAVSMASKTNSTIVPFSITGKYRLFKKNSVTICFGKPYKMKTDDLTKANEDLMEKVSKLILKNRKVKDHE
jgi:1-acyl-sn-glycerol-3-phosphate acyltransferase